MMQKIILWLIARYCAYEIGAGLLVFGLEVPALKHLLGGLLLILVSGVMLSTTHILVVLLDHEATNDAENKAYRDAARELLVFLVALLTALVFNVLTHLR